MAKLVMDDVLRRPVITEKNTILMESGQYTFVVAPTANKVQIRDAVERLFNVKVKAVNTMNIKGQERSRSIRKGRDKVIGRESTVKKAVVTLFPGQRIDIFEQI